MSNHLSEKQYTKKPLVKLNGKGYTFKGDNSVKMFLLPSLEVYSKRKEIATLRSTLKEKNLLLTSTLKGKNLLP